MFLEESPFFAMNASDPLMRLAEANFDNRNICFVMQVQFFLCRNVQHIIPFVVAIIIVLALSLKDWQSYHKKNLFLDCNPSI